VTSPIAANPQSTASIAGHPLHPMLIPFPAAFLAIPLAVITFLMPQVATAQLVRHNSIPEAYWGTWAPADANCQDANKSSIALSDHAYESSATSCVVKYVRRTPGPKGPTCSARLQCTGRGDQPQTGAIANLIIRPSDSDRIFMGAEFASLKLYQRCAKAPSEASH
jgi:hypothetical protein